MRTLIWFSLWMTASALCAREGVVETLDHHSYLGHIRFEDNGCIVANARQGLLVHVPLTNVWLMSFTSPFFDAAEDVVAPRVIGADFRHPTPFAPRVELVSGSVVQADLYSIDDHLVRFRGVYGPPAISVSAVANLRFGWIRGQQISRVQRGAPGVVLSTGEFFEGDFRGYADDGVTASSILFGQRTFQISTEAQAVVLRKSKVRDCVWAVRTEEGSRWLGDDLEVREHALSLREPALGRLEFVPHEVLEIWRR